jgi:hypothetical protein
MYVTNSNGEKIFSYKNDRNINVLKPEFNVNYLAAILYCRTYFV